jgi:hypothetical protein
MDEEGGVSLEEIMGFSGFNGTKREPKHGKKGRNGKSAAPVGTGMSLILVSVIKVTIHC